MTAPSLNMDALVSAFTAPMYALPIDMFRVLAGLVSLWYWCQFVCWTSRCAVRGALRHSPEMGSSSNLVGLILASSGSIPTQARRRGEEQRPMETNHWR
jgi:hypothetical protein